MTPPDSDTCPQCRQTVRFPEGWQLASGQDAPNPIGLWTQWGNCGLWRCQSCGTLWFASFDQYQGDYQCEALPQGVERWLHPQAKPKDALQFLAIPALNWLIKSYFHQARYDLTEAANAIVAEMAREPLTEMQAYELLYNLSEVIRRAELEAQQSGAKPPIVSLRTARPLVRLVKREHLNRDRSDESSLQRGTRDRIRAILTSLLASPHPVVAIDGASRSQLERVSGIRRQSLSTPAEPAPITASLEQLFSLRNQPVPQRLQGIMDQLENLGAVKGSEARDLRAYYLGLLEQMQQAGQIPDNRQVEVNGWIERHGYPLPSKKALRSKKVLSSKKTLGSQKTPHRKEEPSSIRVPTTDALGTAKTVTPQALTSSSHLPRTEIKLKTYLGLIAGSGTLLMVGGFLMGEFLIPAGAFLLSLVFFCALFFGFLALVYWCDGFDCVLASMLGSVVMLGVLLFGHYYAYAWDGEAWAARYFSQQAEQGESVPDPQSVSRRQLLQRMIAERLNDASADGPLGLLRLRADIGSNSLVSYRSRILPDQGKRDAWQMWMSWIVQAMIAIAGSFFFLRQLLESPEDE